MPSLGDIVAQRSIRSSPTSGFHVVHSAAVRSVLLDRDCSVNHSRGQPSWSSISGGHVRLKSGTPMRPRQPTSARRPFERPYKHRRPSPESTIWTPSSAANLTRTTGAGPSPLNTTDAQRPRRRSRSRQHGTSQALHHSSCGDNSLCGRPSRRAAGRMDVESASHDDGGQGGPEKAARLSRLRLRGDGEVRQSAAALLHLSAGRARDCRCCRPHR